jgi:hypothetical protein
MGGGATTTELTPAVVPAGGLGTRLARRHATLVEQRLDEHERAGVAPVGVNVVSPPARVADAEVELAAAPTRLAESSTATPTHEGVDLAHASGALAGWQLGSSRNSSAPPTQSAT